MFHEEFTKDDYSFDNYSCHHTLLDEAKSKLDTNGILWDPRPQMWACNKIIELPVPIATYKQNDILILDNAIAKW